METPKKYGEPDFYIGYLREHLKEHHFDKENTQKFIENRVDDALDTYTGEFASGRPPYICHELAMRTLLEKLYVSRFDIIHSNGKYQNCCRPHGAFEHNHDGEIPPCC